MKIENCYINFYDWRKQVYNASGFKTIDSIGFWYKEIYKYSKEIDLKENFTFYKKYGKGKVKLRFSKSGQDNIEKRYATHFIMKIV